MVVLRYRQKSAAAKAKEVAAEKAAAKAAVVTEAVVTAVVVTAAAAAAAAAAVEQGSKEGRVRHLRGLNIILHSPLCPHLYFSLRSPLPAPHSLFTRTAR